jgi:hypothetical protein
VKLLQFALARFAAEKGEFGLAEKAYEMFLANQKEPLSE